MLFCISSFQQLISFFSKKNAFPEVPKAQNSLKDVCCLLIVNSDVKLQKLLKSSEKKVLITAESLIKGDAIILFFIPAAITSTLYIFVGIKLAKSKTKRVRNRDLTIAFLLSCLLWIFFWLPNEVMKVLDSFSAVARVNEFTMGRAIQKLFAKFSGALFEFSPLINPLVFLFVTRGFQQPIKNLFGALKKMVLRKT